MEIGIGHRRFSASSDITALSATGHSVSVTEPFYQSWPHLALKHIPLEDAARFLPRFEGMNYPITAAWLIVDILFFALLQRERSLHRTGIKSVRLTQGYFDDPCIIRSFFVIGRNCAVNKRRIRPLETFTASASNIVITKYWFRPCTHKRARSLPLQIMSEFHPIAAVF